MSYWNKWSREQSTGTYFRQGPGFTQPEDRIKPKELSEKEINRRAWRKHKQFARDKARNGSIQEGCPPWLKRQCNKEYRRWVRDCITKGQYEKVGSKTRKDYFDPWMRD